MPLQRPACCRPLHVGLRREAQESCISGAFFLLHLLCRALLHVANRGCSQRRRTSALAPAVFGSEKKHIGFGHFQQRSSKGPKLKATLHLLCSAPLLMFFLRLLFFKRRDSSFFCKGKYFVIIISPNRSSLRHHEPIAQAHSAFSDFIQPIHHSP